MNIFLPFENDIKKSIECLDDNRLRKQIVEVAHLLDLAIKEKNNIQGKGYTHHPVYQFYKNNLDFLAYYGLLSCEEYEYRFVGMHKDYILFVDYFKEKIKTDNDYDIDKQPEFIPFYAEGSKSAKEHIRATTNVSELFQAKLLQKWTTSTCTPKWKRRGPPRFYRNYLLSPDSSRNKYWNKIFKLKSKFYKKNRE